MTTDQPTLRQRSLPDQIRYFSRELIKRAGDDLELGGFAITLGMAAERAEVDLAKLTEERDLAIAHDRQPYPTAHAYEMACAALQQHRERADAAEADRTRLANMLCAALGVIGSLPEIPAELQAEVQRIRNGSHGHVCDIDPDEAGVPA